MINPNISLLLLTKNEQSRVGENLKWLKDCHPINEIIVVDDNSTDQTLGLLNKYNSKHLQVKIFKRELSGDFSAQRQFGVSKATNDWVLWLDPDETPSLEMITFLTSFNPSFNAYTFVRRDQFLGRELKYTEASSLKTTRLFHKNHGQFQGRVHETWHTTGKINDTSLVIHHHPHPDLATFWHKINLYSSIRARELFDQNTPVNLGLIMAYPAAKFFDNYFLRLGFREGTQGIIFSLTMSFYSFLTRAKLWQLYRQ